MLCAFPGELNFAEVFFVNAGFTPDFAKTAALLVLIGVDKMGDPQREVICVLCGISVIPLPPYP